MDERPCEVLHQGRWLPGTVRHAYRCEGRWRAVVRYSTGPGENFIQARWEEEVRRPPFVLAEATDAAIESPS